MRVVLAYCYPQVLPKYYDRTPKARRMDYDQMARRFAMSYVAHPTSVDHDLYVVVNGGRESAQNKEKFFSPLVPNFIYHNNNGKDIGAYMVVAHNIPCDFLVCVGSPVRPHLDGWLDYIVRAVEDNGPGIYGAWGSKTPQIHLRTTFFCIQPTLLNDYPIEITDCNRYEFEHGRGSITKWCMSEGFSAMQVTKRGVFPPDQFHAVKPEDSLMLDQHCDNLGWTDDVKGW